MVMSSEGGFAFLRAVVWAFNCSRIGAAGVARAASSSMHSQLPRFLVDNFANFCTRFVTL